MPATSLPDISLASAANDFTGSCLDDDGPEYAYYWEAPATGCAQVFALSDDMDLGLYAFGECGGDEVACNDDSSFAASQNNVAFASYIEIDIERGEDWVFVVEGETSTGGTADLRLDINDSIYCDGSPVP